MDARDEQLLEQDIISNEYVALIVSYIIARSFDDFDGEILPIGIDFATDLCKSLLAKPNRDGCIVVKKGILLTLTNYLMTQQEPVTEQLLQSNDEDGPIRERAEAVARKARLDIALCNSVEDPVTNNEETTIAALEQRVAELEDELAEERDCANNLEDELAAERDYINQLHLQLNEKENAMKDLEHESATSKAPSRRRQHHSRVHPRPSTASSSSASISTPLSLDSSLSMFFVKMRKQNETFLQLLSKNQGDAYIFGHCSVCAVMLDAMSNASDLSCLESLMAMYGKILSIDMSVIHEAKEQIVCVDMKGPVSKALKELVLVTAKEDEGSQKLYEEALAAYNKKDGTSKTALPIAAYKLPSKVSNCIAITMFMLIGIRVCNKISLETMRQRKKLTNRKKEKERQESIDSLVSFVTKIWGRCPDESVTIAWIYANAFVPACDTTKFPSDEVRLQLIKLINFIINELQHFGYTNDYIESEVTPMTELACDINDDEMIKLREEHGALLYICERKDGNIVSSWRRPTVAKVLFSSLVAKVFAKRAVKAGVLGGGEVDMFVFGVLTTAPSNFHMRKELNFLFDEASYSDGNATTLASAAVKKGIEKVLDTAESAMRQFENEAHFAKTTLEQSCYKSFFMSMSTEATD